METPEEKRLRRRWNRMNEINGISIRRVKKIYILRIGKKITGAGKHYVFDPLAGQICKKNRIKVVVIGKNLKNLEKLLEGKNFIGSIIGD